MVAVVIEFCYSVGFLIVVLGRRQLFTETTLTAVLPLFARRESDAERRRATYR